VFNGHVYIATKNQIDVYGLTGKAAFAGPIPLTVPVAPTSGANITFVHDAALTTCPGFVPASVYNVHIQDCGGTYPACETATALSGGEINYLDKWVNLPVSTIAQPSPFQVGLLPNTSGGDSYEVIPGVNQITLTTAVAGTPTLNIENVTFQIVANQFVNLTVKFYCSVQ
jgi:hypothetical protein